MSNGESQSGEPQQPTQQPEQEPQTPPAEPVSEPAAAPTFDASKLPPELQGKTPEQIGELWGLMQQASSAQAWAQQQAQQTQQQQAQLQQLQQQQAAAEPELNLRDLFQEDPEAASRVVFERNYGQLAASLAANALEGVYSNLKTSVPDFSDYEQRTREIVQGWGVPPTGLTPDHIRSAYLMARGEKAEQDKRTASAQQPQVVTEPAKPRPPTPTPAPLNDTEKEIARQLGMSEQEYTEHRDKGRFTGVEPPTEAKGYGKQS